MPESKKHEDLSRRIDLRCVILVSSLLILFVTLLISFYAAYQVQRQVLLDNAHEASRAYAEKVASSIEDFIYGAQRRLGYSADIISGSLEDNALLGKESRRLVNQDASFSSVIIMDADGKILRVTPDALGVGGAVTHSPESQEALSEQHPMVSNVFKGVTGNLVVFITTPIRNKTGDYIGLIGGAIYVEEHGTLHTLAKNHYSRDGTNTYITDRTGRFIHHPNRAMVGTLVDRNNAVYGALRGDSGNTQLTDPDGVKMIAGYAQVPSSGWLVVSERSRASTLAVLDRLMWQMLLSVAPFAVLSVAAIWWLAHLISRPLRLLAQGVSGADNLESIARVSSVRAWYREAAYIKRKLQKGMGTMHETILHLNTQAQTDPLTGLANRRAKREALRKMESARLSFAIIVVDIDHFKSINDTFGHEAGDITLSHLARLLEQCSREGDIICRTGGEEFVLLLPGTPILEAAKVGERLRKLVEHTEIGTVGYITVSLGVASWPASGRKASDAVKKADQLMYRAKQAGRNRIFMDSLS